MRVAIERAGVIENIVEVPDGWTGKAGEWRPPAGTTAHAGLAASIGSTRDGNGWRAPEPTPSPPDRLAVLESRVAALEARPATQER